MPNILVSIAADLPSSIALRYACRLADLIHSRVQVLHIKEPDEAGPAVGTGWARLTWQKELMEQARQEITQLLRDDLAHCATKDAPIVAVGDRESHVLAELGRNPYDLLVEGLPAPPSQSLLHRVLHSESLQKIHCPILLALTMAPLERVLICLDQLESSHVECFEKLMQGTNLSVDLVAIRFPEAAETASDEVLRQRLDQARESLRSAGFDAGQSTIVEGRPDSMASLANDYGLLVVPKMHDSRHEHPWVALLGNTSTSMLLC
jgi:nucleotide-binding universal stress UspA family protein